MVTRQLLQSGTHKDFDQVMKGKGDMPNREIPKLRKGDLMLRNKKELLGISVAYHAGVYCGDEEVIEFTVSEGSSAAFASCSSNVNGGVCKAHVNKFLQKLPYVVLRLKNPIPRDFDDRVKKAMKSEKQYNLCNYNCMHFALELLGVST